MAYKGIIRVASKVEVRLSANYTNSGSALLVAGNGVYGGTGASQSTAVAPGDSASLSMTATGAGLFQVLVDMTDEDDSGILEVKVGGKVKTTGTITGDTQWTYSVQKAAAKPPQG